MTKVQFQTNIPVEVALKFPEGIAVPSQNPTWPGQVLFTLVDESKMYLPPHVAEKIRALRIQPGEPFLICKAEVIRAGKRAIEWQVRRVQVTPEGAADPDPVRRPIEDDRPTGSAIDTASPKLPHTNTPSGHGVLAVPKLDPPVPSKPAGHAVSANGTPYFDARVELERCYQSAIEVLVAVEKKATEQGLSIRFSGEDLRATAALMFIDQGKDRRTPWRSAVA